MKTASPRVPREDAPKTPESTAAGCPTPLHLFANIKDIQKAQIKAGEKEDIPAESSDSDNPNTADVGLGGESFSGLLPTLFYDDLDAFQVDDIFQGGSEADLDNFFANIFSAPSFPRVSPHDATTAIAPLDQELYSQYRSHAEILSGYYRLIHPVVPIFPPPPEDGSAGLTDVHVQDDDIQLAASSPLKLALRALLVLIPDPGCDETFSEDERQAISQNSEHQQRTSAASHDAEHIRGAVIRTFFSLEKSAFLPLQFRVHYIRAEEALVAVALLLVALLRGFASETEVSAFNRDIGILDRVIMHQLGSIGPQDTSGSNLIDSPEAKLAGCLRTTSRARLMKRVGSGLLGHSSLQRPNLPSARIKLHRYRAFMGHPRTLKSFAAATPVQSSERDSAIDMQRGAEFSVKAAQMFPFLERALPQGLLGVDTAIGALGQFSGYFKFVEALKA
ncbi:hypothetical protein CSHISOI_09885 [Colletotrichum shisoi]|uniref:Uncharacterized protein n=1 Tax=Colletotrichum shisoi TaxID=2078593 RepID=A0A5Q4BF08_9PEZI|nr:hypothetical protein CSHISOI_09885 [Colletotrichum shisoi]